MSRYHPNAGWLTFTNITSSTWGHQTRKQEDKRLKINIYLMVGTKIKKFCINNWFFADTEVHLTQSLPSLKNASCRSTIFGCLHSERISISIMKSERSSSPSRAHILAAAKRPFWRFWAWKSVSKHMLPNNCRGGVLWG